MKWRFTHKDLTIIIGILVAMIVLVTLWVKDFSPVQASGNTDQLIQKISISGVISELVEKSSVEIN